MTTTPARRFGPGDLIQTRATHTRGIVIESDGRTVVWHESLYAPNQRNVDDVSELELILPAMDYVRVIGDHYPTTGYAAGVVSRDGRYLTVIGSAFRADLVSVDRDTAADHADHIARRFGGYSDGPVVVRRVTRDDDGRYRILPDADTTADDPAAAAAPGVMMLALAPDAELTPVVSNDPGAYIAATVGNTARPILLGGGVTMWINAVINPTAPNGYASAMAWLLSHDMLTADDVPNYRQLWFGTVVFTGTDPHSDAVVSLDTDQVDGIVGVHTDVTGAY